MTKTTALTNMDTVDAANDLLLAVDVSDTTMSSGGTSKKLKPEKLLEGVTAAIAAHASNDSNPHSVTKTQVGLGNADNTSDANKPISSATQTALDAKLDDSEVGTTANKLVRLTSEAKLPAVDASLLFGTTQTMVGTATTSNYVETYELNNFGRGVPDNVHYRGINTDGALLTHPQVGFGLENYFVVDGTGQKLVEYNFDYTSIDRAVEYRPETFAIDCDTHKAYLENRLASHKIGHRLQGTGIYPAWQWIVDADTNRIASYGSLGIGDYAGDADANYPRFRVTGTSGTSTSHVLIDPTSLPDNGRVVNIEVPAQTVSSVNYIGLRTAGAVKGTISRLLYNSRGNADAVAKDYIYAESGDAFTTYQTGGTPTCIGSDASDGGNWKVDVGATPGSGTALEVDQATRAVIATVSLDTPRVNFDALNYITDTGGNSMAMKCNQFFAFDLGYFLVRSYNGATTYAYMDGTSWDFRLPIKLPSFTVSTLPSVGIGDGGFIYVTNETGGEVPAFCDGTNWRRVTDRAIVS